MPVTGQHGSVDHDLSDGAIIAASAIDAARVGEIFDRHFVEIDRYLERRVGAALADDLAAETFAIAFRARARYDVSTADARPWLFGIAANLLRRHWRTERRRLRAYARTGIDPLAYEIDDVAQRIDALAAGPALAGALASLKTGEREALLLFAWADLNYGEIATALGIPIGTVRSRLSRARARIRALISPSGQVGVERIPEGEPNG